ncbi:Ribosomal protein [Parasponia andersonii]|uniref:Ribosomal protein n=1 Tax=Parasponia andersonii TaxID=3476 RepID=A0A2P5DTK8_PARAD|nr:Ribosomal protein [Parasponia andersonii]
MFGLRSSASIVSNLRLQLLQSINGQRARCINVKAGMEIPDDKRLEFALPYIHGIGRARARQILSELNMENKPAKELTKREVFVLGEELSKYVLGKELRSCVERDAKRLMDIRCYRGARHSDGLPTRGQRTKTNARTKKSQKLAVAARKT